MARRLAAPALSEAWQRAKATVGVDPAMHTHDLRHHAATLMAQMPGITTKELMARIGHSSPRAALIYQHATAERDREVAAFLEGRLDATRPATPRLVALPNASQQAADSDSRGMLAGSAPSTTPARRPKKAR